jgi:phosphatidate cytidylyltransferase
MLKTRLITTVIGIPILLAVLFKGGILWDICFGLMGIIGLWEFYSMIRQKGFTPIVITGYLLLCLLLFYSRFGKLAPVFIFFIFALVIVISVINYPKINIADIALSLTGAIYLGGLLNYSIKIADLENPFLVIMLVFLLTWASDTGGYMGGRLFGKHKLSPTISPKKTIEGSIGGSLFGTLIATIFVFMADVQLFTHLENFWRVTAVIISTLALTVVGQIGDLVASKLKRAFEIKDYGNLFPGHGGVLDRFDSLIFTGMAFFLMYTLVQFLISR